MSFSPVSSDELLSVAHHAKETKKNKNSTIKEDNNLFD